MTRSTKRTIDQIPVALVRSLIDMDQELTPGTWADGYTYSALRANYSDFQIEAAMRLVVNPMKKAIRKADKSAAIMKEWLAKCSGGTKP